MAAPLMVLLLAEGGFEPCMGDAMPETMFIGALSEGEPIPGCM
jgi:hypothetical protein